jgi:ubiquinone biosynthesis protein Coq4
MDVKAQIMASATGPIDPSEIKALARHLAAGDAGAAPLLAGAFVHGAFSAPEMVCALYDAAAMGLLNIDHVAPALIVSRQSPIPIPPTLWPRLWALVEDSAKGIGAGEVTLRTAQLAELLDEDFSNRLVDACKAYPGVVPAASQGLPKRFQLDDLAACPNGSLGHQFYRLIVDNNFDLEVLDRDALGLARLPPPLDYLNMRMLQCHDLWHIVAGYQTTKAHEVAISGFQLAQFGHGYSAMFLSLVAVGAALAPPGAASVLLTLVLSAWVHGRTTPPMLGIPWERIWHQPVQTIRDQLGITPFSTPYPADFLETLAAA